MIDTIHSCSSSYLFLALGRPGLVAMHPVAEALRDEYFYFAWLSRHEAFLRFKYDPDAIFSENIDEYGFRT